jgi:hypothetical protein
MIEALGSSETSVLTKPHCVTSQKKPFFNNEMLEYTNATYNKNRKAEKGVMIALNKHSIK